MNNDRFKFRVPYRCLECGTLYFDNLEWNGWNFTHIEADLCCSPDAQSEKQAEAEQCTGLLDKTGKLIYEGDKVRGILRNSRLIAEGKEDIYEIISGFSEECPFKDIAGFHFISLERVKTHIKGEPDHKTCDQLNSRYSKKLEIIGNIHEA